MFPQPIEGTMTKVELQFCERFRAGHGWGQLFGTDKKKGGKTGMPGKKNGLRGFHCIVGRQGPMGVTGRGEA